MRKSPKNESALRLTAEDLHNSGMSREEVQKELEALNEAGHPECKFEETAFTEILPAVLDEVCSKPRKRRARACKELLGADAKKRKTYTTKQLTETKLSPIPFIIDGLIPQGVGWLAGAPKTGKSFFALQLAVAVGRGDDFLGMKTERTPVLYYCLEEAEQLTKARLQMLYPEGYADSAVTFVYEMPPIGNGFAEALEEDVQETGARLVIVDVFGRVTQTKNVNKPLYEQDYSEMSPIRSQAEELSLSVILLTHLAKANGVTVDAFERIMGGVGKRGSVDFSILLAKDREDYNLLELKLESRKSRELELVLRKDENMLFSVAGGLRERRAEKVRQVYEDNPIVMTVKKALNGKDTIAFTAAELLEALPSWAKYDNSVSKIGRELPKLDRQFLDYDGIKRQVNKGKKERRHMFMNDSSIDNYMYSVGSVGDTDMTGLQDDLLCGFGDTNSVGISTDTTDTMYRTKDKEKIK